MHTLHGSVEASLRSLIFQYRVNQWLCEARLLNVGDVQKNSIFEQSRVGRRVGLSAGIKIESM
jgi:hypothetical protein